MSISKKMTGAVWHTERVHRAEGDSRRHKARCAYYDRDGNHCIVRQQKCFGSAHCDDYDAISEKEFQWRQECIRKGLNWEDHPMPSNKKKTSGKTVQKKEPAVQKKKKKIPVVVGQKVYHKTYGEGQIISVQDAVIVVDFSSKVRKFPIPDVFDNGFMWTFPFDLK